MTGTHSPYQFSLLAIALCLATSTSAQTFVVNTTIDTIDFVADGNCADSSGKCSLRAAIQESNNLPGADTIELNDSTYRLNIAKISDTSDADGDLDITDDLTIVGKGRNITIIDAERIDRIFYLYSTPLIDPIVNISSLTIQNGEAKNMSSSNAKGGGIFVHEFATLYLSDCTITDNRAFSGGGIYSGNELSSLGTGLTSTVQINIENCIISNNEADYGGGITSAYGGIANINNSLINGNKAVKDGGGFVHSIGGDTTFTATTISNNDANNGAGILSYFGGRSIFITNSTISGNTATKDGGGLSVNNSTSLGGLEISNSTITNNSVSTSGIGGGGISGIISSLRNSIIAENIDPSGIAPDCKGSIQSQGFNLIGINNGCSLTLANGDIVGSTSIPVNPALSPLDDYGGFTPTHALLPQSPALDNGNPAAPGSDGACETVDQRGVARIFGDICDIGAYELTGGADLWVLLNNTSSATTDNDFVTIFLQLGNLGPSFAGNISLQIIFPENSEIQDTLDESWSCATDDNILNCTRNVLTMFEQTEFTMQFTPPDGVDSLLTVANISASTIDPVLTNNQSQVQTQLTIESSGSGGGSSNDTETINPFTPGDDIQSQDDVDRLEENNTSFDDFLDRIRWELAWMQDGDDKPKIKTAPTLEGLDKNIIVIPSLKPFTTLSYEDTWLQANSTLDDLINMFFTISAGTIVLAGALTMYFRSLGIFSILFSSPLLISIDPIPVVYLSKEERKRRKKEALKERKIEDSNKNIGEILDK